MVTTVPRTGLSAGRLRTDFRVAARKWCGGPLRTAPSRLEFLLQTLDVPVEVLLVALQLLDATLGLIQLLAQLLVLILQLYRIPPRRFGRLHPFQSNRGARICPVLFRRNPSFTGSRNPLNKYPQRSCGGLGNIIPDVLRTRSVRCSPRSMRRVSTG